MGGGGLLGVGGGGVVHAVLHGVADEFAAVGEAELGFDVLAVGFDGFYGEAEAFGDFAGADALPDELVDLELTVGEALDGGEDFFALAAVDASGDIGGDEAFAADDGPEAFEDAVGGFVFHDVAAGAGEQGPRGVDLFVMHGQHEDGCARDLVGELADEVEAGAVGEGEVEEDDVGLCIGDAFGGVGEVGGLPADLQVGLVLDDGGEAFADDGVVFDEEDAGGSMEWGRHGGVLRW